MEEFLCAAIFCGIIALILFGVAALLLFNADETNKNEQIGLTLLICIVLDIIPFAVCLGQLL